MIPLDLTYLPCPQEQVVHVQLEDIKEFSGTNDDVIFVYFVRHGESALNSLHGDIKYVQGKSPHVELTEKGRQQAEKLTSQMVPRMQNLTPCIVTSTARRAMDTAKPLLSALKQPESAYEEFLELGSGKWEGVRKDDKKYLEDYKKWKDLSAGRKFYAPKVSTGESYSEVARRALSALSEVINESQGSETVFVYSHHMLMSAVAISLAQIELSQEPKSSLPDLGIENGDIVMVEIPRGCSVEKGRVKMVIHSNLNH
jgi:broad specificity phosphatase PhoE